MAEHLYFRGKQWVRVCNHFNLVGTRVHVYFWNSGAKQNFVVEVRGLPAHCRNTWTIPGEGVAARDEAIKKAFELALQYK